MQYSALKNDNNNILYGLTHIKFLIKKIILQEKLHSSIIF